MGNSAMISNIVSFLATASAILTMTSATPVPSRGVLLAERQMSLSDRYPDPWVNEVFSDNILLNTAYLFEKVESGSIEWNKIKKPFTYEMKLRPKETFAFHSDVLSEYKGKVSKTTNAHFSSSEGFRTDGYLFGDGVCHLASLISWAASDAKLEVKAPTNHDFREIPDIPREYGVSIYSKAGEEYSGALQNLYITNNKNKDVKFVFAYKEENLKISVFESN